MTLSPSELVQYEEATELGVRLEMMSGQPYWEFQPNFQHQNRIGKIYKSVCPVTDSQGGCECVAALDVGIRFPDGSLRRPDLSIFCSEPEEQDLITLIPEAVVEIISQRSREKDLVLSPPYFLEMGVKDILVVDPFEDMIHHFRQGSSIRFKSGKTVLLECGCQLEI